ncbi:MAG: tRNA (adenosine(37)-N6)-threonylcarbamoyltransferase complex ATPase subunit type 1 TsaE [Solirubrobacteraceae bacterium]|nr:tRNA (adenosine(37)-N6)-threonylcarbamoyltransferase complex ATPase subunit type 1 TsaE [Solirubrobacteraceae bacterium]
MRSDVTETTSAEETAALAAELAAELTPGDVVLVSGDLGAGKSTFVRGALRAMGVTGPITSPTFTVARRYHAGGRDYSHLDLYRLGDLADEDPALLEDEVGGDRIAFVEWPEVGAGWAAEHGRVAARVLLEHAGADRRTVTVELGRAGS